MSEWNKVSEGLPKNDCICVVWNETRPYQYYVAAYNAYFKEFEVNMIGMSRLYDPICFNATKWMELKAAK